MLLGHSPDVVLYILRKLVEILFLLKPVLLYSRACLHKPGHTHCLTCGSYPCFSSYYTHRSYRFTLALRCPRWPMRFMFKRLEIIMILEGRWIGDFGSKHIWSWMSENAYKSYGSDAQIISLVTWWISQNDRLISIAAHGFLTFSHIYWLPSLSDLPHVLKCEYHAARILWSSIESGEEPSKPTSSLTNTESTSFCFAASSYWCTANIWCR